MKKLIRLLICINAFLFSSLLSYSQSDSCNLRISLLTCSAGEELYSAWGHTAIRVTDRSTGSDMVYNYGTFDDSDPGFYLKFTKGIMHYALSAYPYSIFLEEYQFQNRGIIEQGLNLSCTEKDNLTRALQLNNTDANRFYYYYFHTDNCTTRARDMILHNAKGAVTTKKILPGNDITYRDIIHPYLDKAGHYWSRFGIDLFFGMNMDKTISDKEAMFLPDYLEKGFDSTTIAGSPLVMQTLTVLPWPKPDSSFRLLTPFVVFTLLLVIIAALTPNKSNWAARTLVVFDSLFLFIVGIFGLLMLTLWIIRVDTVCRNNLNVIWALPTHAVMAFFLNQKRNWVQKYFRVVFWVNIALALTWFFIPQQLNNAVAPIVLLLIIRSYQYSKKIP